MNIGIDATCWWNNRGFGRFTRELLTALFELESPHTYYVFTDQSIPALATYGNVRVIEVPASRPTTVAAVADGNRSPRDMWRMSRAVAAAPLDLMFFPTVYSWYPVPWKLPTMLTLMDAIAERYPRLIFPHWKSRLFWNIKVKGAVLTSQRILTISNAAKAEVMEYIGVDADRIDVCSAAPSPDFRHITDRTCMDEARGRAGLPLGAPFLLYVGGLAPHKNLLGLLEGFEKALAARDLGDIRLAIVGDFDGGGFHSNYESLVARVNASDVLSQRVHFTGFVPDEDLVALYSDATAAAMPSFSEGFGLPAIEALACNTPLLASQNTAFAEVAGDAGIYFDPFDPASISDAIVRVVCDEQLRNRLAKNGLTRAMEYTWPRAARLALDYLEDMSAA